MSSAARVTKKPKASKPLSPAVPPFPVHRFTVEEYHELIANGVLTARHRIELIHGWLVTKMTLNPPLNNAVTALTELLPTLAIPNTTLRVQQPITTADSEPEPDVVLAAGPRSLFKTRNPTPAEVHLLVEVADSSLHEDQTTKLELYAKAGVAVYWVVNLKDCRVEVYTQPKGGKNATYKRHVDYGPDDEVPVVVAGRELGRIAVKELLP